MVGGPTSGNGISLRCCRNWDGEAAPRLASQLLAMTFSFTAAVFEVDKRLPRRVSQLLATAFPFVAADFEADKRLPRRASQFLATAFPFVEAVFAAGKRLPRLSNQFLATAISFIAADFVPHLGGLSEGQAEQGSQSLLSHQYGRGVAS